MHLWRGTSRQRKAATAVPDAPLRDTSSREHHEEDARYRLFSISPQRNSLEWPDSGVMLKRGTAIGRVRMDGPCHKAPFGSIRPNLHDTLTPLPVTVDALQSWSSLLLYQSILLWSPNVWDNYFIPNFTSLFETDFRCSMFNNSF